MSDDIQEDVPMSEIKFGVDTSTGTPQIIVESVRNVGLKQPVTHERFNELIGDVSPSVTLMLEIMTKNSAELKAKLDQYSESERMLATYLVEHTAWQFAVNMGVPLFMFNPRHLPDEITIDHEAQTTTEAFSKKKGGFTSVRKGGKKYWEKKE